MQKKTQKETVEALLDSGVELTQYLCNQKYGISRLAVHIHILGQEGRNIMRRSTTVRTRYAKKTTQVTVYWIAKCSRRKVRK